VSDSLALFDFEVRLVDSPQYLPESKQYEVSDLIIIVNQLIMSLKNV